MGFPTALVICEVDRWDLPLSTALQRSTSQHGTRGPTARSAPRATRFLPRRPTSAARIPARRRSPHSRTPSHLHFSSTLEFLLSANDFEANARIGMRALLRARGESVPVSVRVKYTATIRSDVRLSISQIYYIPKEGPTLPLSDDYYIKSICPSGGHGRGHRPAIQNRAAARHVAARHVVYK